MSVEWTFKNTSYETNTGTALYALLEHAGSCLSYLSLQESRIEGATMIPASMRHCENLKYLRLRGNSFRDGDVDLLIQALNSDLGDRLLSLDLSDNEFTGVSFEKLCDFLTNQTRIPALLELRVAGIRSMGG